MSHKREIESGLTVADDGLQRLAPSLKEYYNCDIVDINPGTCVWSSRLHQLLRPRRHLLLEPDKDIYHEYLDPLLSATGSRYHHVPVDTRDYLQFDRVFGQELLPEQDRQQRINHSSPRLNRTLLVTANVATRERDSRTEELYVGRTTYMTYAFLKSYLLKSVFNKYGLVRVLMWLPEFQAERILPKSSSQRTKESVLTELVTNADMITCSQTFFDQDPKSYKIREHSHDKVMSKMAQERISCPENRRLKLKEPNYLDVDTDPRERVAYLERLKEKPDWVQEWLDLENRLAHGEFKTSDRSTKWIRLRNFRTKMTYLSNKQRKAMDLVDRRLRLDNAEDLDQETLEKETQLIEQNVQNLEDYAKLVFKRSIDDYRIMKDRDAGLQWGRRQAEPLVNTPEEFYPQESLGLIDFRPIPSILQKIDDQEKLTSVLTFFDRVLKLKSTSLSTVLEDLAPGGLDYLLSGVPGLEMWAKGINADLSGVRARSIPSSLLLELALAWHRWPFRTSMDELKREMSLHERAHFAASPSRLPYRNA